MTKDLSSKLEEVKIYSKKEAEEKSKEYFKGDDIAAESFVSKYALKDSEGNLYEATPDDMHRRLSREVARIENKYQNPLSEEKIYSLFKNFEHIVPQGSPMSGIGNPYQIVSLSNCFVIGGENDSYGGIMKVDEEQVQLMKRRGGVGHDLSHIRPKSSPVFNSALTSTGVVPFMERYSNSTREVAQDGRRGALMLSLSINHPDVKDFIDAKLEEGKISGANISVKLDDDFMRAVENNSDYIQKFPINSENPKYEKKIKAKELWDKIIHNAWKSAEPGVLFWDKITSESVADCYSDSGFKTVSTNPCGEIPLCPYDSCRLIAMNLYGYVDEPFTKNAKFNFEKFKEHAKYTQRIMDDIIDLELEKIDKIIEKVNLDPEEEPIKRTEMELWEKIKEKAIQGRRTGIGITAEGDMLAALNLRYGTKEATDFSEEVQKNLALFTYASSVELAKERGAFEVYDSKKEENNPFIKRLAKEDPEMYEEMKKHGRRNISLLTIAPTGTTSIMTQTSSGIEPAFYINYDRKRKISLENVNKDEEYTVDESGDYWKKYTIFHPKFKVWMEKQGIDPDKNYSKEELELIIQKSPYYKATSQDVDWLEKVRMQGRVQKWVDHSISTTINLPEEVDEELVSNLYLEAWKSGCKGVTVYREGSRKGVLTTKKENKLEQKLENGDFKKALLDRLNRPRPEYVGGMKEKIQTPHGYNAFVGVNWEKDELGNLIDPYETFIEIARAGDDLSAIAQGYGRIISLALKAGVPYEMISEQLKGIGGNSQVGFGENQIKSLPDAIGKGMEKSAKKEKKLYDALTGNKDLTKKENKKESVSGNLCPACGNQLIMSEGCEHCSCGYSRCG